jgi:multiple sugar transport system substrate-binding protein
MGRSVISTASASRQLLATGYFCENIFPTMKPLTLHRNLFAMLCVALLLGGCTKPDDAPKPRQAEQPLRGVKLRLAVVDDPALAAAIVRMRGEWNIQTGSELEVVETTEKELNAAKAMPADAVVCASHLLGTLAERDWLAPVPQEMLRNAEWTGLFELLKLREVVWGKETMAIPFGSPLFCCYYRADLLEKLGRRPPRTWDEYQELAELLAKADPRSPTKEKTTGGKKSAPWCGALEPLAPGWAGLALLARAAATIQHRNNYSALFRMETMEPQVAGPPMVLALQELVAAAKRSPVDPTRYDPAAVRAAFWRGQCGLAITWPSATNEEGRGTRNGGRATELSTRRMGVVELPGAKRAYNLNRRMWDKRTGDEDTHVPLLAIAGRLGVVGKNAVGNNAPAAFQLLLWLSDSQRSPQVSAASPATTLFRQSNLQFPGQWVEKSMPADAAVQYGIGTAAAFQHEAWLGALRMPGRAEYLAALDEAVIAAVRGERSPADALEKAEKQWRDITDRLGLDRQRDAYKRSLGLE